MVVDHIRNRDRYAGLGENIRKGLEYLAAYRAGRTEACDEILDGDDLFVRIRPCMTRPVEACSLEMHRAYADIHFVARGRERIGWADIAGLRETGWDEAADAGSCEGPCSLVTLEEGMFMITFPEDAHMPCVEAGGPAPLEKLIVKVRV